MFEFNGVFGTQEFDNLIVMAAKQGASGIFFNSNKNVFIKIKGALSCFTEKPISYDELSFVFNEIFSPNATQLVKEEDRDFVHPVLVEDSYEIFRFRCNATACETSFNEDAFEITLRPIPSVIPCPWELGVPKQIVELMTESFGLLIVSGTTGSGKTTTIASMIHYTATNHNKRILTFEAPVEFVFPTYTDSLVVQTEIYKSLKDFYAGGRNSLRRETDIVLIGELRDKETITIGTRISKFGSLVLATTHTSSAGLTLKRLAEEIGDGSITSISKATIDVLSETKGVLHQRLYPNLQGGRTAVFSYLIFTPSIKLKIEKLIDTGVEVSQAVNQFVLSHGCSLKKDGRVKFLNGMFSLEIYLKIIKDSNEEINQSEVISDLRELKKSSIVNEHTINEWLEWFSEGA